MKALNTKKTIHWKYLMLVDILLASGMAAWEYLRTASLVAALSVLLAVLLAASPLAYIAGTPLVLLLAKSLARKKGIAIAKSKSLETLNLVDTLAIGKSGTITEGDPFITDLVPEGLMQSTLLSLAATVEQESEHPIARVICRTAEDRGLTIQRIAAFNEIPGCGVEAILSGSSLRVGRPTWLQEEGVKISANLLTKIDQLAYHGKIPVVVAEGRRAKGIIAIKDSVNKATADAIRSLSKMGIGTVMLTSDSQRTAAAIGKEASVSAVRPNLSPEGKAREIQLMRARGMTIAMAGSPDQDGAAFHEADLSIALGQPPREEIGEPRKINLMDIKDEDEPDPMDDLDLLEPTPEELEEQREREIEEKLAKVDMVLPGGLPQLPDVCNIAGRAHGIIRQNHWVAIVSWILLIPPAMGILGAIGGPMLSPFLAFLGMLAATFLVLLNSLRMRKGVK